MTPAALLLAQTHEAPPAHLLIVAVIAVAAAVGWLLLRFARRRGDEPPSLAPDRTRSGSDSSGTASKGDDRA
jgi:hypothetical protein